ncbi:MAG: type II secretion system protein [Eubacterium sp.]|nr:type II secretion system protein [Eubacterium sp.]
MKKRIQKYLSGSNEGFSLVELIIVIAIMAILIGVVALAVIPYLEKSRESKDLQALDTVASAVTTAIADKQITGSGSFDLTTNSGASWGGAASGSAASDKIVDAVKTTLGEAVPSFSSNNAKGKDVKVFYNASDNIVYVYLASAASDTHKGASSSVKVSGKTVVEDVAACRYNDNALFCISNTKVEGKGEAI